MKKTDQASPEFSLEKSLAEIRSIVEKMQQGSVDFDEQVTLFKKGQDLIKQCQAFLDQSELTIKQLVDGELKELE